MPALSRHQSDPDREKLGKRDAESLTAVAFWQHLAARPVDTVQAIDFGASFHGAGNAVWRLRGARPDRREVAWFVPGVELMVSFLASARTAQWSLTSGAVKVTLNGSGATLTVGSQVRQQQDAGDAISVRIRREGLELQISMANGPWVATGSLQKEGVPLRFAWGLGEGGVVQVLTHPSWRRQAQLHEARLRIRVEAVGGDVAESEALVQAVGGLEGAAPYPDACVDSPGRALQPTAL